MMDVLDKQQLVKLARKVERLMAKRRRLNKQLRDVENDIRTARRFLGQLAAPTDQPCAWGERGELLSGEGN